MSAFSSFFRRFFHSGRHSLAYLNVAQFGGVLNDNMFKLFLVYLLIDSLGTDKASSILSAVGAIFVIPFLLFSSTAGVLADRFSKQKLLMIMKIAEITIMALAVFAFYYKSQWAGYTLLFFLASHSALFGPSKYSIIPELVPSEAIAKANGLVTSFTYLAIIIGTFLASFITDITNRNFVFAACFCLLVAIVGLLSTFGIKETPPQGSKKAFNFLFVREIYRTLVFAKTQKHLLTALFGSAFFLFIGAFVQLNIIPFAIQSLNLKEVDGGYLFLSTALGIAGGSLIAGKASRKRVELGISCLAGMAIFLFLMFLGIFSTYLISVIICLFLLGLAGGCFIVPFDSYAQTNSPDEKRGQVIAAANFLSFCGVLLASISLYFFNQMLGLSPAQGFFVMGLITLAVSLIFIARLSDYALAYIARKIVKPFFGVRIENQELAQEGNLFILKESTWLNALLLLSQYPHLEFIIPKGKRCNIFYSIHRMNPEKIESYVNENKERQFCVLAKDAIHLNGIYIKIIRNESQSEIIFISEK